MQTLKFYQKPLIAFIVLTSLMCHSPITLAQTSDIPAYQVTGLPIEKQGFSNRRFYVTAFQYDGATALGCFWPQLFSGFRSNALWMDASLLLPGIGVGYRQLFQPLQLNGLCFWGGYAYLESPNYFINPYGMTIFNSLCPEEKPAPNSPFEPRNLFLETLGYMRWNVGTEIGIPYMNITLNAYGFLNQKTVFLDSVCKISQEKIGCSARFSYPGRTAQPFLAISSNYVSIENDHSKNIQDQWLNTFLVLGVRYKITDSLSCQGKLLKDFNGAQQHYPLHLGLHYSPATGQHSKALPQGYNALPERFIPHYQNSKILREFFSVEQ